MSPPADGEAAEPSAQPETNGFSGCGGRGQKRGGYEKTAGDRLGLGEKTAGKHDVELGAEEIKEAEG